MRGVPPPVLTSKHKTQKNPPNQPPTKIFIFKRNKDEPEPRKNCPRFSFDKIKINVKGSGQECPLHTSRRKNARILANSGHWFYIEIVF